MNSGLYKGQVEHKYDYSANQFNVRTWGWSSTSNRVGLWFINPSVEYLSGGPTKFELSAHRDATFTGSLTAPAPPTLLNYWRGSHYGGSICNIAATDAWTKVIGPFLIYCNTGRSHDAVWKDALAREKIETAQWPYDWVNGVDYPHKDERATVSGQIVLKDPQAPKLKMGNLLVGLDRAGLCARGHCRETSVAAGAEVGGGGAGGGFSLSGGGEDEAAVTNQNNFAGGTNTVSRPPGWRPVQRRLWVAAHGGLAERREALRVLGARRRAGKFRDSQRPARHLHTARDCRRSSGRIHRVQCRGHQREESEPRKSELATRPLRQTNLGHRHPEPHRLGIFQRRRLFPLGLVSRIPETVPQRRELRHWQERFSQGLVLRAGAAQ